MYQTKKGHLRKDSEENPTSEDGSGSSTSRREQCVKCVCCEFVLGWDKISSARVSSFSLRAAVFFTYAWTVYNGVFYLKSILIKFEKEL